MTTKVTGSVLANTAVTPGTYGSSTTVPIITVDGQGRITSATAATVSGGGGGSGTTTYTVTKFTATAGQTVFTVNYTVGYVQVFLNGVLLDYATDFTAANGTSITLATGAALNDIVTVYAYSVTSVSNITGGSAGVVLYQSAANTTSNTAVGTSGQLLVSGGAGSPVWTSNIQVYSLGVGTAQSGVLGEIRAANDVTAFYSSDKYLKENIQDIDGALDKVVYIGGKYFDWTDDYINSRGGEDGYFIRKHDFGVIAQDVQEVFPEAVRERGNGTLAVDYEKLSALAFAAIKELKQELDELKNKEDEE